MVSHLFISAALLGSFCAWGRVDAALVNVTVEDFSSLMQYSCAAGSTFHRCDANTTNANPCDFGGTDAGHRTLTIMNEPCQIKTTFIGKILNFEGGSTSET
jgi:hypothetical protein